MNLIFVSVVRKEGWCFICSLNFFGQMNKCRRERILMKVGHEEVALFDLPVYMSQGWFSLWAIRAA